MAADAAWEMIESRSDPETYKAFLRKYGDCDQAEEAKERIRQLQARDELIEQCGTLDRLASEAEDAADELFEHSEVDGEKIEPVKERIEALVEYAKLSLRNQFFATARFPALDQLANEQHPSSKGRMAARYLIEEVLDARRRDVDDV